MTLLKVEDLHGGYGDVPVLQGIDLSVNDGEVVGVLGHNGMGKTTFLRTLMGYLPATRGRIFLSGADVGRLPIHQRARLGLGLVPQGREIFPSLSVRDNLRMGLMGGSADHITIGTILADFPRLERLLDRSGGTLSGGEQQLLSLARCLCTAPRLMLLDEPTEGIQPSIIDEIVDTIVRLRRRTPLTVIVVEQNLDFISALSDRVLIIQKGVLTREVSARSLGDAAMIGEFVGFSKQSNQKEQEDDG